MKWIKISLINSIILTSYCLFGQHSITRIDSLISKMTIEEKIGQVFMLRAFSYDDRLDHIKELKSFISEYNVGGLCFFQGIPEYQITLTNEYQKLSKIPLLISIDGEWGLGMRFKEKAVSFPKQLTMGALTDHNIIYDMGYEVAHQMKSMGIHINFAPVVDVNNNPNNPVINFRSFGENKENVTAKAYAYMKGMQDGGLLTCLKHFPGHGDTATDSHYDLPIIKHDTARIDSVELFPFKTLINKGADGVMVAHLNMPALDKRPNRPTTLSYNVITNLLKKKLNFKGLIFTDAMEMQGVTKHFEVGEAEYEAFMAGNDVVLLPSDFKKAFDYFLKKHKDGFLTHERLNHSVRKILTGKNKLGLLNDWNEIKKEGLKENLFSPKSQIITEKIYENALTLVRNKSILPLKKLHKKDIASLSIGAESATPFQNRLDAYAKIDHHFLKKEMHPDQYNKIFHALVDKDLIIIGLHDMSRSAKKNFNLSKHEVQLIRKLSAETDVILVVFGSPYSLKYFEKIDCVIGAYEEDALCQDVAAQAIFGAISINGKLPVNVSKKYKLYDGIQLPSINRFGFSIPERVGMNSDTLSKIATLIDEMIQEKASPGGQILVAKDNKIVYQQAFGHYTYKKKNKVGLTTIYDVASITKILASTISAIHLESNSDFSTKDEIGKYFNKDISPNKKHVKYTDMMAHMGGLLGWIPFYKSTLSNQNQPKPSDKYYKPTYSETFGVKVLDNLYLRSDFPDSIRYNVLHSRLREEKYILENKYLYSDLGFYILNWTIEQIANMQVNDYAKKYFYHPLGLKYTLFNPIEQFDKTQIAPSENDQYFRMGMIQGYVHDMGAAMLHGVSGHAGLFSTSYEVGILMQMLLNGGYYGGKQYLNQDLLNQFTKRHPLSTRRGIGFDMKELDQNKTLNMSEKASEEAFGHLGFTGCAAFADPKYNLVYVFLSNRTFPSMKNNKFGKKNYRPRVQTLVYNSFLNQSDN